MASREPASVDDPMGRVRMFNPVTGAGNLDRAADATIESGGGGAEGWCTLGVAVLRPAQRNGISTAGVSAMLLDQVLGHAPRPGILA